jgi:hypothetical protein
MLAKISRTQRPWLGESGKSMSNPVGPSSKYDREGARLIVFAFTLLRIAIAPSYGNLLSMDAKEMPSRLLFRAILRDRGIKHLTYIPWRHVGRIFKRPQR